MTLIIIPIITPRYLLETTRDSDLASISHQSWRSQLSELTQLIITFMNSSTYWMGLLGLSFCSVCSTHPAQTPRSCFAKYFSKTAWNCVFTLPVESSAAVRVFPVLILWHSRWDFVIWLILVSKTLTLCHTKKNGSLKFKVPIKSLRNRTAFPTAPCSPTPLNQHPATRPEL